MLTDMRQGPRPFRGGLRQQQQQLLQRHQQTEGWIARMLQAAAAQNGEAFARLIRDMNTLIPEEEIANMPETEMTDLVREGQERIGERKEIRLQRLLVGLLRVRQLGCTTCSTNTSSSSSSSSGSSSSSSSMESLVLQWISLLDIYIDYFASVAACNCSWLVSGLAVVCAAMDKAASAADRSAADTAAELPDEAAAAAAAAGAAADGPSPSVPSSSSSSSSAAAAAAAAAAADAAAAGSSSTESAEDLQHRFTKQVLNAIRPKLGKLRGEEGRNAAYLVLVGRSIKRCLQLGNMQMAAGFLKLCDCRSAENWLAS
ncbi:proteasome PCI domain-containing protein, putative [Eimeria brunetti]|uniref:Proteasome PCI domain-containing protein, putative n=1 Tax=Eimeria brunetti TaxID=51314 RepID=U6LBS8_9EIME|nr:proteasome PCI domain-containing protein, putative [Eimeria brunetti]